MKMPESHSPEHISADSEAPPPFLRTWNRVYVAVILYTCALIGALYYMTVSLNS
jgi:hypothetical protein